MVDQAYDRPDAVHAGSNVVVRASAAGGCRRALWYWIDGVAMGQEPDRNLSDRTLMIMESGQALEPVVVNAMRRAGWEIHHYTDDGDAPLLTVEHAGVVVSGHPDALGRWPGGDQDVIIEIKTRGPDAFARWQTMGAERSHPESVYQAAVYSFATFGEPRPVVIVTMNTGERDWDYEIIPAERVRVAYGAVLGRLSGLPGAVSTDEPPDRDYHASSWKCLECPFLQACRPELLAIDDDVEITDSRAAVTVSEEVVGSALRAYVAARAVEGEAKRDKAAAGAVLTERLAQQGLKSATQVVDGMQMRYGKVRRRNYKVDHKALNAALPPEVREEIVTERSSEYLRVS